MKLLTGYIWENSDSVVPGKAIIIIPLDLSDGSVVSIFVGTEAFKKHSTKWKDREIWYGSKGVSQYLNRDITLTRQLKETYIAAIGETIPANEKQEAVTNPTYGNGDRPHFRFSKPGSEYGDKVKVYIDDKLVMTVPDGSKRFELSNGLLWKPISDSDDKLVILGKFRSKVKKCLIVY